jgi:hypothetical protein
MLTLEQGQPTEILLDFCRPPYSLSAKRWHTSVIGLSGDTDGDTYNRGEAVEIQENSSIIIIEEDAGYWLYEVQARWGEWGEKGYGYFAFRVHIY